MIRSNYFRSPWFWKIPHTRLRFTSAIKRCGWEAVTIAQQLKQFSAHTSNYSEENNAGTLAAKCDLVFYWVLKWFGSSTLLRTAHEGRCVAETTDHLQLSLHLSSFELNSLIVLRLGVLGAELRQWRSLELTLNCLFLAHKQFKDFLLLPCFLSALFSIGSTNRARSRCASHFCSLTARLSFA